MAVLSRLRELVDDYRAAKTGVALLGGVGAALSPLSATAQTAPATKAAQQVASLEPHCSDIKMVTDAVGFNGAYGTKMKAWVASGCKGSPPLPERGDTYNIKSFNAAAGILASGADIRIAPN